VINTLRRPLLLSPVVSLSLGVLVVFVVAVVVVVGSVVVVVVVVVGVCDDELDEAVGSSVIEAKDIRRGPSPVVSLCVVVVVVDVVPALVVVVGIVIVVIVNVVVVVAVCDNKLDDAGGSLVTEANDT